jgi:hypothetical protein
MTGSVYGKNVRNATELIEAVARKLGLPALLGRHRVFVLWEDIVGGRYAAVAQPEKIQGKTLVITAADNSWAHDLKMHAPLILEKIAAATGDDSIKKLRVVVGTVTPPPRPPEPPEPLANVEVDVADIEAALAESAIKDKPALREAMAHVWANGRRLAKRRQETGR